MEVLTNKATHEEQCGIPHHLLGLTDPMDGVFCDVRSWLTLARAAISDIHRRGKVPVVVGGTHYWVEALLWPQLIGQLGNPDTTLECKGNEEHVNSETAASPIVPSNSEAGPLLYERLCSIDPVMAAKLHPNDTRKIIRSLQVFEQTGIPHGKQIEDYKKLEQQPPYYDACLVWVDCDLEVLDTRVDARVDDMVKRGLIQEVEQLHQAWQACASETPADFTRGLFQVYYYYFTIS